MASNAEALEKLRTVLDSIDGKIIAMMNEDPKTYELTTDQLYNLLRLQQQFRQSTYNSRVRTQGFKVPTTAPTPAEAEEKKLDFSWLE